MKFDYVRAKQGSQSELEALCLAEKSSSSSRAKRQVWNCPRLSLYNRAIRQLNTVNKFLQRNLMPLSFWHLWPRWSMVQSHVCPWGSF